MQYREALAVAPKEVVTFVGGGGKTTAMFRLADELASAGRRVVVTTTTRIFAEQMRRAPHTILSDDDHDILARLPTAVEDHRIILVVRGVVDQDRDTVTKADGISADLVARIRALPEVDAVLVEGDGSRRRSFKAPAEHEPVVPDCTSLLVPVVGIDVIGLPLTDEHVHRASLVASLAGVEPGVRVTEQLVAEVIGHAHGGRQGRPPRARFVPLVNKVDTDTHRRQAERIAHLLCRQPGVDGVAVGAVLAEDPILKVFLTPDGSLQP